jgi:hypothetical protein
MNGIPGEVMGLMVGYLYVSIIGTIFSTIGIFPRYAHGGCNKYWRGFPDAL